MGAISISPTHLPLCTAGVAVPVSGRQNTHDGISREVPPECTQDAPLTDSCAFFCRLLFTSRRCLSFSEAAAAVHVADRKNLETLKGGGERGNVCWRPAVEKFEGENGVRFKGGELEEVRSRFFFRSFAEGSEGRTQVFPAVALGSTAGSTKRFLCPDLRTFAVFRLLPFFFRGGALAEADSGGVARFANARGGVWETCRAGVPEGCINFAITTINTSNPKPPRDHASLGCRTTSNVP